MRRARAGSAAPVVRHQSLLSSEQTYRATSSYGRLLINGEAGTTQPDDAPPTVIALIRAHHPQLPGNPSRSSRSASSWGDIEDRSDRSRIEDRHPSHTDPLSSGRQPQSMDRGDRRILDHLRHRVPAETMSLGGFAIGKDGYVARRVIEPGELQPSVLRARSGVWSARASALQAAKFRRTSARREGSLTRTNRQGWLKPTDGARQASSSSRSTAPSGSASQRNRRTSRRQANNARNRARNSASNAGANDIATWYQHTGDSCGSSARRG
jgi:hypothetical protein